MVRAVIAGRVLLQRKSIIGNWNRAKIMKDRGNALIKPHKKRRLIIMLSLLDVCREFRGRNSRLLIAQTEIVLIVARKRLVPVSRIIHERLKKAGVSFKRLSLAKKQTGIMSTISQEIMI